MNKFKKILLGTMLGLAVTAPAVGMVGCSKVDPKPDTPPVVEPEDPEEETQELSTEKLSKDFKSEILKLRQSISEKLVSEDFSAYKALAERIGNIESQIFEAQSELLEIAQMQYIETESVHAERVSDVDWVPNEDADAERVAELSTSLESLYQQNLEARQELEDFIGEVGGDPILRPEDTEWAGDGQFGYGLHWLEQMIKVFEGLKLNKFYSSDLGDATIGAFKIDENTIMMNDDNGLLVNAEYKENKLSKIKMLEVEGILHIFDFENKVYLYAGIEDQRPPETDPNEELGEEEEETYYSPFKNFNDGKLSINDVYKMYDQYNLTFECVDFSGEKIEHFFVECGNGVYGKSVEEAEGDSVEEELSEEEAEAQRVEGVAAILSVLKKFGDLGLKLPTYDVCDEFYAQGEEYFKAPLQYYEGEIDTSEIDFDSSVVDEMFGEIGAFFNQTYADTKIIIAPKFELQGTETEMRTEPESIDESVKADEMAVAVTTFKQVGVKAVIVPKAMTAENVRGYQIMKGLPVSDGNAVIHYEYLAQNGDASEKAEHEFGAAPEEEAYKQVAYNGNYYSQVYDFYNQGDYYFGLPFYVINPSDYYTYSIIFAIQENEDGLEQLVLAPFNGAEQGL